MILDLFLRVTLGGQVTNYKSEANELELILNSRSGFSFDIQASRSSQTFR